MYTSGRTEPPPTHTSLHTLRISPHGEVDSERFAPRGLQTTILWSPLFPPGTVSSIHKGNRTTLLYRCIVANSSLEHCYWDWLPNPFSPEIFFPTAQHISKQLFCRKFGLLFKPLIESLNLCALVWAKRRSRLITLFRQPRKIGVCGHCNPSGIEMCSLVKEGVETPGVVRGWGHHLPPL